MAPLALLLFGATASRSYVDVAGGEVVIRAGGLGSARFPLSKVRDAAVIAWPVWRGFGARFYGRGAWGFVGRRPGVVEIRTTEAVRIRVPFPARARRIAVSVEDPAALIGALTNGA